MNRTQVTAVITRSLTKDYGYLGAPGDEWWAAPARFADLDEPAVLTLRDHKGLRLLVSGIPSARRDSANRQIRVTLVLEGDDRPALLRALVRAVLNDSGRAKAGARLDEVLTESVVEDLRAARDRPLGDLADAILNALQPDPDASESALKAADQSGSWVGALKDPQSVARFLARFDALLAGDVSGYALATHKVVTQDGAERAHDALGPDTAVLTLSEHSTVRGVTPLGKKAPGPGGPSPALRRPMVWKIAAGMAILVLVVALLLWLGWSTFSAWTSRWSCGHTPRPCAASSPTAPASLAGSSPSIAFLTAAFSPTCACGSIRRPFPQRYPVVGNSPGSASPR